MKTATPFNLVVLFLWNYPQEIIKKEDKMTRPEDVLYNLTTTGENLGTAHTSKPKQEFDQLLRTLYRHWKQQPENHGCYEDLENCKERCSQPVRTKYMNTSATVFELVHLTSISRLWNCESFSVSLWSFKNITTLVENNNSHLNANSIATLNKHVSASPKKHVQVMKKHGRKLEQTAKGNHQQK